MNDKDTQKNDPNKTVVSLYLDKEVIEQLDDKASGIQRSRSWMANFSLRQNLGLPPSKPDNK